MTTDHPFGHQDIIDGYMTLVCLLVFIVVYQVERSYIEKVSDERILGFGDKYRTFTPVTKISRTQAMYCIGGEGRRLQTE